MTSLSVHHQGSCGRSPLSAGALALVAFVPFFVGCATAFGGKKSDEPLFSNWTANDGWVEVTLGESSAPAAAEREEARKALDVGDSKAALDGLLAIQERYPDAAEAHDSETYFLIGESYLKLSEYEEAHRAYRRALAQGARGDLLNRALNRIYHIGLFYLQGKAKRSFLGISYTSPSFGVDILIGEQGLFSRYAHLEYADDGLLEIARHYFEKLQYPEAEKVYERLVQKYPLSEWAELAAYQLAVTAFKQVRGVEYDQAPLMKARRFFNTYRNQYPRGVHIESVREHLAEISEMEAQHDLTVAKYYLRESRPEAAIYYLREVRRNNSNTKAAVEARQIFEQMENYRGLEDEAAENALRAAEEQAGGGAD